MANKLEWTSVAHIANLLRPEMELRQARARGNAILKARAKNGDAEALEKLKRRKVKFKQAASMSQERQSKKRKPRPPEYVETLQQAKNKLVGIRAEVGKLRAYEIGIVIRWIDKALEQIGSEG